MKIFNLHSKSKKSVRDLKRTSYKEYDENGKLKTKHYIEFEVVGKNRTWKDFMSVVDFKKLNPDISIKK